MARQRRELPWVRIDKEYVFETDEGKASLADLFRGRSQLLTYHFMFGPDYAAGCPACSAIADGFNGFTAHLANHDVMLWAVSRAPVEKLQGYKRRMGWSFPWASSSGSDFNYDLDVSLSEEQERAGAFLYYRGLGVVSVSSLLIAALLAYLSVVLLSKYQNFTMSLSAIAGLVVAIGITADSFIVYFERLRDEVREGKTLRPAVEGGWRRARRTILVSDTVSFLAAVLLYHFAVSDVQGFAYTLGLTTLIDVIVVFLFTKPMVTLLAGTKFYGGGHPWSGLDPMRLGARPPSQRPSYSS